MTTKKKKPAVPIHALPACSWVGDVLTVPLYIPAYCLSPNGRPHRRVKHAAGKKARALANLRTLQVLAGLVPPCPLAYSLAYYWPGMARDDDNAIASAKAYLDGICSALGVDDRNVRFRSLYHHKDRACPRLEIILHLAKS